MTTRAMLLGIEDILRQKGKISEADLPRELSEKEKNSIIRSLVSIGNHPCRYNSNVHGDIMEVFL